MELYNGKNVGRDLANWQNIVPMVNYGCYTYEIEDIMVEAIQEVLEGRNLEEVLTEYHNKAIDSIK